MKSLRIAVVALAFAAPVISFAQGSPSLTRAQVRAELVQAEKAGYSPTAWADFPYGEVQAAEFRKAARRAAADPTGYDAGRSGSSQPSDIAR
ncbi:DUF4148 domain-containing protein [Burkholderia sp. Ac-20365]|uniref:DUF4148 domain-containing protein n=1 Tax=Burkholderia sp. Ac-20365 TaxID=2703897 RepID=UPI00197C1B42|nr:DUF4148 domain-containing protein [Burkholderia sp. Ac-20365]MBN3760797.1 DUF4148 domain-containing protein [Burkholderia sp. Ac-20365]